MTVPQRKQIIWRCVLLGCSFAVVGVLALGLSRVHGSPESSVMYVNGRTVVQSRPGQTAFQANPVAVAVILMALLAACVGSGISLLFRVMRRSTETGIAGMVVGGAVGVIAILGLLTVGPYLFPLVALLVIVALPLDEFAEPPSVFFPA